MKIRIASALLALSLPLLAQEPAAAEAELLFYKAFYLEKSPRDFAGAMALYEQFLAKAPEHKLAAEAARQHYSLLDRTGKTKEKEAFAAKYGKLLGNAVAGGAAPRDAAPPAGDAPRNRPDGEARPGRGQGGPGGQAGGPGGRGMGGLFGQKKLAEMTPEELGQFKEGLGRMEGMIERLRERMPEEQLQKVQSNYDALKKALDANQLDEAQKAADALREAMPMGRRRGGEGGGPGGGAGGGAGGGQGGGAGGGRGGRAGGGGGQGGGGGGGGGGGN